MFSIKRYLSMLSFNKKDYNELKSSIRENNYRVVRSLLLIVTILFSLLYTLSYLLTNDVTLRNKYVYQFFLAAYLCLYLLTGFIAKKHTKWVMVFVYIFMFLGQILGIIIGIVKMHDHPAITFIVLQFVMPILFIDRPWRFTIFNFVFATIFLYLDYKTKEFNIFFLDLSNLASFFILGNISGRYFINTKIQGLKAVKIIETERDTDSVTGVLSKAAFMREMERLFQKDSSQGIFLMIDIDNFKHFNDTYGHDVGDQVLNSLGECMRRSFRQADLLGRFGGDEFFVFIPGTNDTDVALYRAKRLQILLKDDLKLPDSNANVTLSIGISNCKTENENYQSLFKRADEAIYEAKAEGKNTIIIK